MNYRKSRELDYPSLAAVIYAASGTHTLTVTLIDNEGLGGSYTQTVSISGRDSTRRRRQEAKSLAASPRAASRCASLV